MGNIILYVLGVLICIYLLLIQIIAKIKKISQEDAEKRLYDFHINLIGFLVVTIFKIVIGIILLLICSLPLVLLSMFVAIKVSCIIVGSILLALGLYFNFKSLRIRDKVMGNSKFDRPGPMVYDPKELDEKKKNYIASDNLFSLGIALTLLGITLNAIGALLP